MTIILAILGAITGTISLGIQLHKFLADRPQLKLKATMSIASDESNPAPHLRFQLSVVNIGQRLTRIEHVGISLKDSDCGLPGQGDGSTLKLVSSELTLFDSEARGRIIELPAEGGKHTFELGEIPDNIAQKIFQSGGEDKAFIRLTSGKELFASFIPINPDDLKQYARS